MYTHEYKYNILNDREKNIHRTVFTAHYHLYKKEIYMGVTSVYKIIEKCQKTCNNLIMLVTREGTGTEGGRKRDFTLLNVFRIYTF